MRLLQNMRLFLDACEKHAPTVLHDWPHELLCATAICRVSKTSLKPGTQLGIGMKGDA